jgi:UDP-glucose 4-epimerase
VRDYIHVSDLTDIHIKALDYLKKNNRSFILNCGYGKGFSVKEIVSIFKKIKKNLVIKYQKRRAGDIAEVYSNTERLKKLFDWKPRYNNINKIINSAISWEKKLKFL